MARIRTIKPDFFMSEDIIKVSPIARLVYIGLWCQADREGRMKYKKVALAAQILPADMDSFEGHIEQLEDNGLIIRYSINDKHYLAIPTFLEHQRPHRTESPSVIPCPDGELSGFIAHPTKSIRENIYKSDGFICAYCCEDLKNKSRKWTLDHVIPLTGGGDNSENNLVMACKKCNFKKGKKTLEEAGMPIMNGKALQRVNGGLTVRLQKEKEKEKELNKKELTNVNYKKRNSLFKTFLIDNDLDKEKFINQFLLTDKEKEFTDLNLIKNCFNEMLDWSTGNSKMKADWIATFRNWLRRESKKTNFRGSNNGITAEDAEAVERYVIEQTS